MTLRFRRLRRAVRHRRSWRPTSSVAARSRAAVAQGAKELPLLWQHQQSAGRSAASRASPKDARGLRVVGRADPARQARGRCRSAAPRPVRSAG